MGKNWSKFILSGVLALGLWPVTYATAPENFAQRLIAAKSQGQPLPNLPKQPAVDMSSAYQIQREYVKSCLTHDEIAGFKASLTSYGMQAYFGITRPVFGVLLKSGNRSDTRHASLKNTHRLEVDMELGFITKKPIHKTIQSIAELKTYIRQVVPVIEMPDVGFADPHIHATDLVAANSGAHIYIYDKNVNWIDNNINNMTATLVHNGVIVNQGEANDALGDQWEALRWLVNQVLAHGWEIKADQLLITGGLGEEIAAQEGVYLAQFNDKNMIEFKVTR